MKSVSEATRPGKNWDLRILDPEEHLKNQRIEEHFGQYPTYFLSSHRLMIFLTED
jgi:hypothetical protein